MRYFLKVGLSILLSLLFIQTQAQFNVNSLFTPVDIRYPGGSFPGRLRITTNV